MNEQKIAVIGMGMWGKNIVRNFYNLNVLEMVCDLDDESLKMVQEQFPGVKVTKDFNDIINNKSITGVAVVTPSHTHFKIVKAMLEAEAHNGPSIIIAYSTCISHGLKKGMGFSIRNMDEAVKAGYWHLYRFNPQLKEQGKNPFTLDSKEPQGSFRDFIMDQVRYSAIAKQYPEQAEELFQMTEEHARRKYAELKKLAEQE